MAALHAGEIHTTVTASPEPPPQGCRQFFVVYEEVIGHSEQSHATSYTPTVVTMKETTMSPWIRLMARTS
ncbi:MAG: hypothetical protein GEV28_27200 [Actinophytocola sp.]|nr:hypothetical protein [Actinophytocola sp.]